MDSQSLPVRYWDFGGPMPADASEGRIAVGIAYHVERKERLVFVRLLSKTEGIPEWEMWLDKETARELVASLRLLEPWFVSASAEADEAGGPMS